MPREPLLIKIPAGASPAPCRYRCGDNIYWAQHPSSGKMHPVSINHGRGKAPDPAADGLGVSHFTNCPHAHLARRPRMPAVTQLRGDSVIIRNATTDPMYRPWCKDCRGLVRMQIVERFFWRCPCGAEHDERANVPQGVR